MKVLYVLRSTNLFAYHESAIRFLCARGHHVHALFDREWSAGATDAALRRFEGTERFSYSWSLRRDDRLRRVLFASRELLTYISYVSRTDQSIYYAERWRKYLPTAARLLLRAPGGEQSLRSSWLKAALLKVERMARPVPAICEFLRKENPSVVAISPMNMRYAEEVEYAKAARSLGIPTVVPVLSWDNLTTKGLFHVVPDVTLAWSEAQFKEATQIHRLPESSVVVTGSQFFDKWLDPDFASESRAEFCRRVGLNPNHPYLLYLGSSANIASDESWLVRELAVKLRKHADPLLRTMQVLVRPHPANVQIYGEIADSNVAVWPRKGALPDTPESLRDFSSSLRYCVAAAGINTTGMIDAIMADKPCIAIISEQYKSTQVQAVHFRHLYDAEVLELAPTTGDVIAILRDLHGGQDLKGDARRRFVADFARPRGLQRRAGEIVATAIELAGKGKSGAEIARSLPALEDASTLPASLGGSTLRVL